MNLDNILNIAATIIFGLNLFILGDIKKNCRMHQQQFADHISNHKIHLSALLVIIGMLLLSGCGQGNRNEISSSSAPTPGNSINTVFPYLFSLCFLVTLAGAAIGGMMRSKYGWIVSSIGGAGMCLLFALEKFQLIISIATVAVGFAVVIWRAWTYWNERNAAENVNKMVIPTGT